MLAGNWNIPGCNIRCQGYMIGRYPYPDPIVMNAGLAPDFKLFSPQMVSSHKEHLKAMSEFYKPKDGDFSPITNTVPFGKNVFPPNLDKLPSTEISSNEVPFGKNAFPPNLDKLPSTEISSSAVPFGKNVFPPNLDKLPSTEISSNAVPFGKNAFPHIFFA